MEKINMSGSGNLAGNKRLENDVTKSKACPDIYRDLTNLTSQVQMMSDSLAACRQMSKYRPARKVHDIATKAEARPEQVPRTSVQILLPPEEKTQELRATDEKKNVIVSYMMKETRNLGYLGFDSLEEISGKTASEDELECERVCQKLDSPSFSRECIRPHKKNHKAPIKVDPDQLIEIIQRELKILMDLAPPVAVLVAALSDTLFHYKGCPQCKEKILSSLPWILNRIQKLIKYVTVKRRGTFCWPSDYECLQFEIIRPAVKNPEEVKKESVEPEEEPEELSRQIGKLEKVDATAVADDRPGVQILLEVNTDKQKKRFFDRAGRKFLGNLRRNFPAVQLKEPASAFVVEVLKPSPKPKVFWDNKREIVLPREVSHGVRLWFVHPSKIQTQFRVLVPEIRLQKSVKFIEEPIFSKKSLVTVLVPRSEDTPFRGLESQRWNSDERRPFTPRDFLANAPELVKDLLKEAEEEKMQIQKVKELELEVKGLKDLMMDVHKNQMELSKVLLEKGVYSQPIIKLTDPNMLEEESRAVRKAAEIEIPGPRAYSVENLQTTVGDLKRKCILKNRMITTLLKGLRSDVPKEWWEEIMNSTFDESKPIEEFDSEKMCQFIRQATLFLMNCEKATRSPREASRTEELLSEGKKPDKSETKIESDGESDYVTGLEDFPESEKSSSRRKLFFSGNDPCHTSFIQNILYEDSCMEVKVVNLFVALKRVKDYVDFLSKCNSEVSEKIEKLHRGTGDIRKEYADLLRDTEDLLTRINDIRVFSHLIPEQPEINLRDSANENFVPETDLKGEDCSECGQPKELRTLEELLSNFKEKNLKGQGPNVPEALLGSFLASLLWLQREQPPEMKKADLESAVEMIHEILDKVTPTKKACLPLKNSEDTDDDQDWWSGMSSISESRERSASPSRNTNQTHEISSRADCSLFAKDSLRPKNGRLVDAMSEGESEYEEPLNENRFSVNCMGDLTKDALGKKSASTLTPPTSDVLSEDIRTKIKSIKSNTKVKIEPLEKNFEGASQFTITADTPVGVFDVTVVQFKKRRHLTGREVKPKKARVHGPSGVAPTQPLEENYSSEDSFQGSDFESVEAGSQSSEDELEEFLEVYVNKSKSKKIENPVTEPQKSVLGVLRKAVLKSGKAHFFEIQKCHPVYFAQRFVKMSPKTEPKTHAVIDEEEFISLDGGEVRQKQVVIKGSSEDLVIFIQLEVEDSFGQSPSNLVLDYQTNSLGTQTKDEVSALPEKETVKLVRDEPVGESLYDVWTHVEDEEIKFDEPLVKEPEAVERTTAHVLVLKKAQQRAVVLHPQRETQQRVDVFAPQQLLRVSEETIKTINENAEELEKALSLIRRIENDIADVKLGDAISILPQLESELRKHLQSKLKDFEQDSDAGTNIDSFFSAVDFWPEEDSGTEEFSSLNSEDRLNNLLKMLSDLEEAVRSNERSKDNIDFCQFSSSKIYKLLHALTVSIRELEERPSITSLSQTLDIASQLDTAVREYDSIIKRQPFDYVVPEKKSRRRRNKSGARQLEESPVNCQHLKNVRQKVFQIVEVEADAVEDRIERDFDRLDRIEKENDEALMFLELFLQKTERRVTELTTLKSELQNLSLTLRKVYESLLETVKQKKEKEIERIKKEAEKRNGKNLEKQRKKEKETKQEKEAEAEEKEENKSEPEEEIKQEEEAEKEIKQVEEAEEVLKQEEEAKTETEQEIMRAVVQKKESKDRSVLTNPSTELNVAAEVKLVRETLSGLLIALDSLKTRAKKKHEACKEIFSSTQAKSRDSSQRSSKSSFVEKNTDALNSSVREFKRIGTASLYLAWTKPEGPLKSSIAGYQICVDGKLNQKVRNPNRLQAILYSVDLEKSAQIELFAVTENNSKILIAIVPLQLK